MSETNAEIASILTGLVIIALVAIVAWLLAAYGLPWAARLLGVA